MSVIGGKWAPAVLLGCSVQVFAMLRWWKNEGWATTDHAGSPAASITSKICRCFSIFQLLNVD